MSVVDTYIILTDQARSEIKRVGNEIEKATGKGRKGFSDIDTQIKENQGQIMRLREKVTLYRKEMEKATDPVMVKQFRGYINGLEKQIEGIRHETDRLAASQNKVSAGFARLGNFVKLGIGLAIGRSLMFARAQFDEAATSVVKFDSAMTRSLAIVKDVTSQQRIQMEQVAKDTARALNIEAEKVAESYFFLFSAGLNIEQSMAAIPVVARFAKAGMFDLATATDLVTDAQSALGLTTDDTRQNLENMSRVADVVAKANILANASIEQFSTALTSKAGTAMKTYGIEVEQGVAVLAAYADQGIKAERAGERFNILLRELTAKSRENAQAFKDNGIAVYDSAGNVRNLADIVEDFERKLLSLSKQQQESTLAQMGFSSESKDGILPILGASKAIREYEAELRNAAGTTEQIANKQLKSLEERAESATRSIKAFMKELAAPVVELYVKSLEHMAKRLSDNETLLERQLRLMKEIGAEQSKIREYEIKVAEDNARARLKELDKALSSSVTVGLQRQWDPTTGMMFSNTPGQQVNLRGLTDSQIDEHIKRVKAQMQDLIESYRQADGMISDSQDREIEAYERIIDQLESVKTLRTEYNNLLLEINTKRAEPFELAYREYRALSNQLKGLKEDSDQYKSSIDDLVAARVRSISVIARERSATNALMAQLQEGTKAYEDAAKRLQLFDGYLAVLRSDKRKGSDPVITLTEEEIKAAKALAESIVQLARRNAELAKSYEPVREHLGRIFSLQDQLAKIDELSPKIKDTKEYNQLLEVRAGLERDLAFEQEQARIKREQHEGWLDRPASRIEPVNLATSDISVVASPFIQLMGIVDEYEQKMFKLTTDYGAGRISEEMFGAQSQAIADEYYGILVKMFEALEMDLTDEQLQKVVDFMVELRNKGDKAGKSVSKLSETLSGIADSVDAVLNLASAFGDVSSELQNVIRGASSAARGIANLTKLKEERERLAKDGIDLKVNPLAFATGGLAVASGVITIGKGIIDLLRKGAQDRQQRRREEIDAHQEQLRKLEELNKSIEENGLRVSTAIKEMLRAAQVGTDISGEQAMKARGLLSGFDEYRGPEATAARIAEYEAEIERIRGYMENAQTPEELDNYGQLIAQLVQRIQQEMEGDPNLYYNPFVKMLEDLENLGIKELENLDLSKLFQDLVSSGVSVEDAINRILDGTAAGLDVGLRDFIDQLTGNLGGFSNTVEGAIAKLRFLTEFMGYEAPEAFRAFIDMLIGSVEGLSDEMKSILDEASGLDITTDEGRSRLNEIIAEVAAAIAMGGNTGLLGGLSASQLEEILGALQGLASGTGSGGSEYSRSVQIARSITEIQANEVVALLDEIAFLLGRILGRLGGSATSAGSAYMMSSSGMVWNIEDMESHIAEAISATNMAGLEIQGRMNTPSIDPTVVQDIANRYSTSNSYFQGANMTFGGKLSEREINEILVRMGDELRRRSSDPFQFSKSKFRK